MIMTAPICPEHIVIGGSYRPLKVAARRAPRWCEMSAYVFLLVYAFIVGYAAAALFVAIKRLEPNIGSPEYSRSSLCLRQQQRS